MLGTRGYRACHRHPRGQVAVIEEMVLGEPDEIESEPVEHNNLFHDRGVQARHVHARFRRVAEIVDGADAKGWTHDAWSPLVRMFAGSVQPRGLGHHLDGLGLTRSHAERIRAAVLPGAVAFAYARRWADQRFQIDPLVRHGSDGFVLVAGEVQFLDALGDVAEPAPDHDVVVKILGPVTHAAHIQRYLRLQARQRPFHVAVDLNMHGGLDGEILQALAVAGAPEALLQPRAVLLHGARHEAHWQPAVGDFSRQLDHRLTTCGEIDRDVGVHVQDRLQRLGEASGTFALVGQA